MDHGWEGLWKPIWQIHRFISLRPSTLPLMIVVAFQWKVLLKWHMVTVCKSGSDDIRRRAKYSFRKHGFKHRSQWVSGPNKFWSSRSFGERTHRLIRCQSSLERSQRGRGCGRDQARSCRVCFQSQPFRFFFFLPLGSSLLLLRGSSLGHYKLSSLELPSSEGMASVHLDIKGCLGEDEVSHQIGADWVGLVGGKAWHSLIKHVWCEDCGLPSLPLPARGRSCKHLQLKLRVDCAGGEPWSQGLRPNAKRALGLCSMLIS